MTNANTERRKQSAWRDWRLEIWIFLGGLVAANLVFISKAFRQGTAVSPEAAAQLGSFVGGYVGALFTLAGIVLLIRTLKTQQRAATLQSFENKYFELIKMHRDNVAELKLGKASGRKIFVLLIPELRSALGIVREICRTSGHQLDRRKQMQAAYYCLFLASDQARLPC